MTPEQAEEQKALDILAGMIPPEPSLADNPDTIAEAVAWAYGEIPHNETVQKYVKLSPNNNRDFEIRRGQKVRYYTSARFYRKLSGLTRLVMFSGGLRVLR